MSKIKDALYTARWALTEAIEKDKYNMLDTAVDRIAEAQALIAELPAPSEVIVNAPSNVIPIKGWKPTVRVVKGVKFKNRGKYKGGPKGGLVHYTVSGRDQKSAEGVVRYLAKKGLGCPVIDEDGIMYVPEGFDWETDIGAHAGASKWNGYNGLNSHFIGFELCNWGTDGKKQGATDLRVIEKNTENMYKGVYQKYTAKQEEFLFNVMPYLKNKYPNSFKYENVCGHDEVRAAAGQPGGKSDPGGSFSISMPTFRKKLLA